MSDLRDGDDTSVWQTFVVSAAEPQHSVLSHLSDLLPQ